MEPKPTGISHTQLNVWNGLSTRVRFADVLHVEHAFFSRSFGEKSLQVAIIIERNWRIVNGREMHWNVCVHREKTERKLKKKHAKSQQNRKQREKTEFIFPINEYLKSYSLISLFLAFGFEHSPNAPEHRMLWFWAKNLLSHLNDLKIYAKNSTLADFDKYVSATLSSFRKENCSCFAWVYEKQNQMRRVVLYGTSDYEWRLIVVAFL